MIFRKVSVSASLYTIFLTVLALVDYFVTVFRGNAFFIMDIFNVGTAADVAENYSLAIPIKSGICLLTILIFLCLLYTSKCRDIYTRLYEQGRSVFQLTVAA